MKKQFLSILSIIGSLSLMAGCTLPSGSSSQNSSSTSSSENHAAVFSGVQDVVSIHLGETFAALQGVTATDEEDGDLTASIVLSSIPVMVNNEGIYTPDAEGDYYITYTVTDSGSLVSEAYTTLTVLEALPTETLFQTYDFTSSQTLDMGGWDCLFSDTATGTILGETGNLAIDVTNLGSNPDSILFYKGGNSALAGTEYKLKFYMYASVATAAILSTTDYNGGISTTLATTPLALTTTLATYELTFTPTLASETISFRLSLGGNQNTETFKLTIALIELVATTGTEVETILVSDDFATAADGWGYAANAGSSATLSVVDETLNFAINAYASENKAWNINLYRNTGINLTSGHTYRVSMDINVTASQFYELCFEDVAMDWQIRAGFKNGTYTGPTAFTYTFVASMNITGLYIKLALGQGSATSNLVNIDHFRFAEITGNQNVTTTSKTFALTDENAPWGSNNSNGGLGEIYCEDGKLFYSIAAFGESDWHNKFFIKSIALTAMASYRFAFTVYADKAVTASFIVNEVGAWNPQITETVHITTEATTFTFTTEDMLLDDFDAELLFQFGGFAENTAPALICFSNISVFQIV